MNRSIVWMAAFGVACGSGGSGVPDAFEASDMPGMIDPAVLSETSVDGGLSDGSGSPELVGTADAPDLPEPCEATDPQDQSDESDSSGPTEIPPPPPPPRARVTVASIPDTMNGKIPYTQAGGPPTPFRLRMSVTGFSVEACVPPGSAFHGAARITASVPVAFNGEILEPGEDLAQAIGCSLEPDLMNWPDEEATVACRVRIPSGAIQPTAGVTFTATFLGEDGAVGEPDAITVDVADLPPYLDPFDTTDIWVVTLSRDMFANAVKPGPDGTYGVTSVHVPEGNGIPDLEEGLTLLGFLSDNPVWSVQARDRFVGRVRAYANGIFGLDAEGRPTPTGVNLRLFFEGDAGSPDPASWTETAGFSKIALGGDPKPVDIQNNIVGRAWIDWNNQKTEDDAGYGMGVFVTSIVRQVLANPLGAQILATVSPVDGTPLGMYPGDEQFLDPDFDPEKATDPEIPIRHAIYKTILDFATLAVASTLCHEMGHSLGLVPDGPPPGGLFGGMDDLSFTESNPGSAHIDTSGLNVEQTGKVTSYLEVFGDTPRFNQLSAGYLRRKLVVGHWIENPQR